MRCITVSNAVPGKPETFNFLGFMLICSQPAKGLSRSNGRPGATADRQNSERSRRSCAGDDIIPYPKQGQWLQQVVRGFFAYHAVPINFWALVVFLMYM